MTSVPGPIEGNCNNGPGIVEYFARYNGLYGVAPGPFGIMTPQDPNGPAISPGSALLSRPSEAAARLGVSSREGFQQPRTLR